MINFENIRTMRSRISAEYELRHDIRKLASRILELSIAELQAENGSIFLIENRTITFQVLAYQSSFAKVVEYKIKTAMNTGLSGWAYQNRQGALSSDTSNDERWVKFGDEGDEIRSAIAIPFLYFDEIIAVMTLHHTSARYFNELHLAIASEVAKDFAPVMEAVRLSSK